MRDSGRASLYALLYCGISKLRQNESFTRTRNPLLTPKKNKLVSFIDAEQSLLLLVCCLTSLVLFVYHKAPLISSSEVGVEVEEVDPDEDDDLRCHRADWKRNPRPDDHEGWFVPVPEEDVSANEPGSLHA